MYPDNWHPLHDLPQTCGGRKYLYPVCIRSTENFQSHPSTSFRINETLYSKCNKQNSTINKNMLVLKNWRIFYIIQINQLVSTSSYTHLAPLPWPSTSFWGKQIFIYCLDISHRNILITPEDKFQYQLVLIRLTGGGEIQQSTTLRLKLKLQRKILSNGMSW